MCDESYFLFLEHGTQGGSCEENPQIYSKGVNTVGDEWVWHCISSSNFCWWKLCIFMESQGKHSKRPKCWRLWCGKVEGCPPEHPISIHPTMKKSNFVFMGIRNKTNVHKFCAILKLSLVEPVQFPAGPRWLLDPQGCYKMHKCVGEYVLLREGEREGEVEGVEGREREKSCLVAWDRLGNSSN